MQKILLRDFLLIIIFLLINLRHTFELLHIETVFFTYAILLFSLMRIKYVNQVCLLFSLFLLSLIQTNAFVLFQIVLIAICFSSIKIKDLAKYNLIIQLLFFLINYLLLQFGFLNEKIGTEDKAGLTDWGYGNINTFSCYIYFLLISLYLYFSTSKYKYFVYLLILIISCYMYDITKSRTYLISEVIMLFFAFPVLINKSKLQRFSLYLLPLLIIIIIAFMLYEFSIGNKDFDIIFSGRFHYTYKLLSSLSLKDILLGFVYDADSIVIDIAYVKLISNGGVMFFLYFLFLYYKSLPLLLNNKQYIPVVISLLIVGMSESVFSHLLFSGGLFIWFFLVKYSNLHA